MNTKNIKEQESNNNERNKSSNLDKYVYTISMFLNHMAFVNKFQNIYLDLYID